MQLRTELSLYVGIDRVWNVQLAGVELFLRRIRCPPSPVNACRQKISHHRFRRLQVIVSSYLNEFMMRAGHRRFANDYRSCRRTTVVRMAIEFFSLPLLGPIFLYTELRLRDSSRTVLYFTKQFYALRINCVLRPSRAPIFYVLAASRV